MQSLVNLLLLRSVDEIQIPTADLGIAGSGLAHAAHQKESVALLRVHVPTHQLILLASDQGQPVSYESTQPLQVVLDDIDDNEPVFIVPPVRTYPRVTTEHVPACIRTYQHVSTHMYPHVPACTHMHVPTCTRMDPHVSARTYPQVPADSEYLPLCLPSGDVSTLHQVLILG